MRKKVLSIFTAILSGILGISFLALGVIFIISIDNVEKFITTATDNVYGLELLGKVGIKMFISILIICLSFCLAGVRGSLVYFYGKLYKEDDKFYVEHKGGIIFFSVLSLIAVLIGLFLFIYDKLELSEYKGVIIYFVVIYLLCSIMPIIELLTVRRKEKGLKEEEKGVVIESGKVKMNVKSIKEELDDLAKERVENKESEKGE